MDQNSQICGNTKLEPVPTAMVSPVSVTVSHSFAWYLLQLTFGNFVRVLNCNNNNNILRVVHNYQVMHYTTSMKVRVNCKIGSFKLF